MVETDLLDINFLSQLTRLKLSEEESKSYKNDLKEVLKFFSVIDDFIENTETLPENQEVLRSKERSDAAVPSKDSIHILRQSPKSQGSAFVVPRVFE